MNLSQVQAQLSAVVNRRDFTANTALQQTFIAQAIMRIQRELRCPAMEKSIIVTIATPYNGLVIPNDLLELQYILPLKTPMDAQKLTMTDITTAIQGSQVTDLPLKYCRDAGVWVLAPAPVTGDQIKVVYWAELAPLVNPTDTNVISIIAWDLIVYAAASQAGTYYKDSRKGSTVGPDGRIIDGWEGEYNRILDGLQFQSDEDDLNSGAAVQACYAWPQDGEFDFDPLPVVP